MDSMSAQQILLMYQEDQKQYMRELADELTITRAAYHAKEVKELMDSLTNFEGKKGLEPKDLMKKLRR